MPQPTEPSYLRTAQVAEFLQVSPKTVSRWAQEGRLPFFRTLGGHRRYPTPRSGPCWKPCPSYPRPANCASPNGPSITVDLARWPYGIVLRSIGVASDWDTTDFLRARSALGLRVMSCTMLRTVKASNKRQACGRQ